MWKSKIFDLGHQVEGTYLKEAFIFQGNIADIIDVKTSCGCTVVKEIKEDKKLNFTFRVPRYSGNKLPDKDGIYQPIDETKNINIIYQQGIIPQVETLTIKVKVQKKNSNVV